MIALARAWKTWSGRCNECGERFRCEGSPDNPYPNGFDCPVCKSVRRVRRVGRVYYAPASAA